MNTKAKDNKCARCGALVANRGCCRKCRMHIRARDAALRRMEAEYLDAAKRAAKVMPAR